MDTTDPPESPRLRRLTHDLTTNDAAIASFWEEMRDAGTPLVEPIDGDSRSLVTFLWRGDATTGQVVLFSQLASPAFVRLARLRASDVWYASYPAAADVRTTYGFIADPAIPVAGDYDPGDSAWQALAADVASWLPDPLSRLRFWLGPPAPEMSVIELPGAPPQPWSVEDAAIRAGRVEAHRFESARLGNARVIWTYLPPGYDDASALDPVVVLFDGWEYRHMGVNVILDNLIAAGRIPPVVCAMVHQLDRMTELACDEPFTQCMADELLPWLRARYRVGPDRAIVGGASLGGLGAAFAALRRPDVFGGVISQSASFWWWPGVKLPFRLDDAVLEPYWLCRQYEAAEAAPLRICLDVGSLETGPRAGIDPDQVIANRRMRDVLLAKGYDFTYAEFSGGHDHVGWRGTFPDALIALLGPQ